VDDIIFSISMTNYNNVQYIETAIKSVLDQIYENFELLIVDDCSTDNSVQLIRKYKKKDSRIKFLKTDKQRGVANAHKLAFESAKGKYIAIVDSDDYIFPTALLEMKCFIDNNQDCGFWYSNYVKCDVNLRPIKSGPNHFPIVNNSIIHDKDAISHLKILKKADYEKSAKIDIKYIKAFDRDIVLRMEEVCKFAYYPRELYYWRGNKKGISRGKSAKEALRYYYMACEDAKKRRGLDNNKG
jgi:glycosyltransferase involved in cell wall biosynthesis